MGSVLVPPAGQDEVLCLAHHAGSCGHPHSSSGCQEEEAIKETKQVEAIQGKAFKVIKALQADQTTKSKYQNIQPVEEGCPSNGKGSEEAEEGNRGCRKNGRGLIPAPGED